MRHVKSQLELATLQDQRRGFIVNDRGDERKLHRAFCTAIGAMHAGAYPKYWCATVEEGMTWLRQRYREKWDPCGVCSPIPR